MGFRRLFLFALTLAVLISGLVGPLTIQSAFAQKSDPVRRDRGSYNVCALIDREALHAPYTFKYGVSGDDLQHDFFSKENPDSYRNKGFRPDRLTGYRAGDDVNFMTKWSKFGAGDWKSWFGMTGDEFHKRYLELKSTHRPVDVSGYNTPDGQTRYNVVWEENTQGVNWKIHRDVSRQGMQDLVNEYEKTGWVPVRVEGYLRDGRLTYISIWEQGQCRWKMHNQMTREEYQDKLDTYKNTLRLVHLDAFNVDGEVFYAGIWLMQDGPVQQVRSDRDWYLFQRFFNNYRAEGYMIDNFFAVDDPSGWVRYGGIWTHGGPLQVDETSSLSTRLGYQIDRVPGRAGGAMIDLTTGEQILKHGDQAFGTSSTIKIAILYALLRKADAHDLDLDNHYLFTGEQYGSNNKDLLVENDIEMLSYLAEIMIDKSHNWATNRLIDFVGRDQINQELAALGLTTTRFERYMTGKGAPSAHGNSGPVNDIKAGYDNFSTPREFVTMLQLIYDNDGLLSEDSYNRFFDILSNASKGYAPLLLDEGIGPSWGNLVTIYNKGGSNAFEGVTYGEFAHRPQLDADFRQGSDAGYFEFTNGGIVAYAAFVDEWDFNAVDPKGTDAVRCLAYEFVKDYSDASTGVVPDECAYP